MPQDTTLEQVLNDLKDLQVEAYAVMRLFTQPQVHNTKTIGNSSKSTSTTRLSNEQLSLQLISV